MKQLIYCSRPFGFDQSILSNILATARRCNARDDITGALICRRDLFCQVLEGPDGKVENCFSRIQRDDRHVEVHVLVRTTVQDQLFGNWAMYHDPQHMPIYSEDEVRSGALLRASEDKVQQLFRTLSHTVVL